jgi:hypothetical protein
MYCNQSSWLDLRLAVGGLSVAMSTTQFIQDNKTRIQNMDGNLDEAAITIMADNGRLEFYYFENGCLVSSRSRIHKW